MKKLVSIALLVVYLLPTTELIEVVKLPMLFRHYQQHKVWDSQTTFLDFLYEHYAESTSSTPDQDLDRQLPFKSHADHAGVTLIAVPPLTPVFFPLKETAAVFHDRPLYFYAEGLRLYNYPASIWQPPRSC